MEPDIRKDVRLLLFWGIRSHDSGGMSEQGVFWEAPYPLRKAPLYFVQLLITILGRASPRPIHCQSNEAQVSKEACASLVFHVRTQKFLCEAQKAFGKHNWREPITRRARTARIGVSQPSRRVQRMSGLSCFTGIRSHDSGGNVRTRDVFGSSLPTPRTECPLRSILIRSS